MSRKPRPGKIERQRIAADRALHRAADCIDASMRETGPRIVEPAKRDAKLARPFNRAGMRGLESGYGWHTGHSWDTAPHLRRVTVIREDECRD